MVKLNESDTYDEYCIKSRELVPKVEIRYFGD